MLNIVERRNLHRRDLTPSQRAMIAVEIKKQLEAEYAQRQKAGLKREPKPRNPPFSQDWLNGNTAKPATKPPPPLALATAMFPTPNASRKPPPKSPKP